jgi:ribosomal protein S18 acetylase RimI-like enzyme
MLTKHDGQALEEWGTTLGRAVDVVPWKRVTPEARDHANRLLATVLADLSIEETDSGGDVLVGLGSDGHVLGAIRVVTSSVADTTTSALLEMVPEIVDATAAEIASVAVDPSARRQGAARQLVAAAESEIRRRRLPTAWAAAWIHPGGRSPGSELFMKLGYSARGRIELYWFKPSPSILPDQPGSICPDCGAPCRCTAAIFVKRLIP